MFIKIKYFQVYLIYLPKLIISHDLIVNIIPGDIIIEPNNKNKRSIGKIHFIFFFSIFKYL